MWPINNILIQMFDDSDSKVSQEQLEQLVKYEVVPDQLLQPINEKLAQQLFSLAQKIPSLEKYIQQLLDNESQYHGKLALNVGIALMETNNHLNSLNYCLFAYILIKRGSSMGKQYLMNMSAEILNEIGSAYYYQMSYKKAQQYYRKCLQIQEKQEGEYSIVTATTLSNLGMAIQKGQSSLNAIQYYKKALKVNQNFYGQTNQYCITPMVNLAACYLSYQNYVMAHELLERCLAIIIAEELVITNEAAIVYNNLGTLYYKQEEYHKALDFYTKSQQIDKEFTSNETAITLQNLGLVFWCLKQTEKSKQSFRQSLELQEKLGSTKSIQYSTTLLYLGELQYIVGNQKDGKFYFNKALEIRRRLLHSDNHLVRECEVIVKNPAAHISKDKNRLGIKPQDFEANWDQFN